MPAATANPWGALLGEPVPHVCTGSAHLVVCGKRVSTPAEVLAALRLPSLRESIEFDQDSDSVTASEVQLARRYCERLDALGMPIDQDDVAEKLGVLPVRKGGRPRKPALPASDEEARRALRTEEQRIRRERARREAAAEAAKKPAPLPTIEPSLAEKLAQIDADETLTSKQKAARRFYARNRDALIAKAVEYYQANRALVIAKNTQTYNRRRAQACDAMGVQPARLSVPCSPEPGQEQSPCA